MAHETPPPGSPPPRPPAPPAPPTSPPGAPGAAPPTTPGVIRRTALPYSRTAAGSLVCAVIGLLVAPLAIVAIVLGITGLRRIGRSQGTLQGRGVAVAGICLGVAGLFIGAFVAFMVWSMTVAVQQVMAAQATHGQQAIHAQLRSQARWRNRYPGHIAELTLDAGGAVPVHHFVRSMGNLAEPRPVRVGAYDFAYFDGSPTAQQAVRNAIDTLGDPGAVYRFGDVCFVRLDAPTDHADIVFCWFLHADGETVIVTMDDGTTHSTSVSEWSAIWEADAAARVEAGLPALAGPPDPDLP